MRGKRSSISKQKLDVVLEAVRKDPQSGELQLIRGYRRRGVVWSDWELYRRDEVVEFIQRGLRVATGRPAELEGDFEILSPVHLDGNEEDPVLLVDGSSAVSDDLRLPLF